MARIDCLDHLLFPVATRPLHARISQSEGWRDVAVSTHQAVVDARTERVVGVVGRGYRLVSHAEALELGRECCRAAFAETKPDEWQVSAADGPATGSLAFIDLNHNSTTLDFASTDAKHKPDVYGPFVRVTNSYNGQRALSFDIGFYRKVCRNGLIVKDTLVRFKFDHQRRNIDEPIVFDFAQERFTKHKLDFLAYLDAMKDCEVPRSMFARFVSAVLGFRPPAPERSDELGPQWNELLAQIEQLADRYARELGENAYAVFNVITDVASRPPVNRCVTRDMHSLQRRAGQWSSEFAKTCVKPSFDLDKYLSELNMLTANPRRSGARS